jgi:3-methyladenine DNA glycosylase AlkC
MSFKLIYNKQAINIIAKELKEAFPSFDDDNFKKTALKGLNALELKERVNHIANALCKNLPHEFKKSAIIIKKALPPTNKDKHISSFQETKTITGFLIWPFTRYTELQGLNNFKEGMDLLSELTKRFSSEFAIRSFIEKYEQRAYQRIEKWSKHKNFHIRRLASEGTRPFLPWGQKVIFINDNIPKNLEILKGMEKDESEYVRKSVANHLNDISKLDAKIFFKHIKSFDKKCKRSQWVKRHAMRSLLKASNPQAMKEYGYSPNFTVSSKLNLLKDSIKEGQSLPIQLQIKNTEKPFKALIEYKVHYMKSNGKLAPKVFRLRDTLITKEMVISKEISFKKVTTRKHYPGVHKVEIILNGKSIAIKDFTLYCTL